MILLYISILFLASVSGHIRLTWPPARPLALDFLDNSRTKGPCGMPKNDQKTDLLAGSRMNISWFMAYPHKGGFQIQLMDQNEEVVTNLTPAGEEFYGDADPTLQQFEVTLPETECEGCVLRLQRQASEWGKLYKFWSCSDVNIVKEAGKSKICQNGGKLVGSNCECPKLFSGEYCQFSDICADDTDCSSHGVCHKVSEVSYPKKLCMCKPGYFGFHCEKESTLTDTSYDPSQYQTIKLGAKNKLLWRKVEDEIEFVIIDYSGETWAAVGWRPQDIDDTCKNFPNLDQLNDLPVNPEVETEPEPGSSEPEPAAEKSLVQPEPETKPANNFAAILDSNQESQPFYVAQTDDESLKFFKFSDFNPFSDANNKDGKADPWYLARTYQKREDSDVQPPLGDAATAEQQQEHASSNIRLKEPVVEPERKNQIEIGSNSDSKIDKKPSSEGKASSTEPEPKSEGEPNSGPEGEPEPENAAVIAAEPSGKALSEPKPEPQGGSSDQKKGSSSLHPMDCQDIIAGCVIDGPYFALWDMYTRDRSTPFPDHAYGGQDSVTGAVGWQDGEATVMMFRRKIKATDKSDHNLEGEMHVIWAKGQAAGNYFHSPESGIEHETAKRTKDYYEPHVLRYHGTGADDRGIVSATFGSALAVLDSEPDKPAGKSEPNGCTGAYSTDDYAVEWDATSEPDSIQFKLTVDNVVPNRWYGIGVSTNQRMEETDIYLVEPDDDKYHVNDRYATGYSSPDLDDDQDLTDISATLNDGTLTASFRRQLSTTDSLTDVDLQSQCVYLVFPSSGGPISQLDGSIGRHLFTPEFSEEKYCFGKCRSDSVAKSQAEPEPEPNAKAEPGPEPEPKTAPKPFILEEGSAQKYICERQYNIKECAGNLQQKWVTRWYRMPGSDACNVYINAVCTEAHKLKTLPTEQQCYQACFTEQEKATLPVFRDIEFIHGYLITKRS